MDNKYSIYRNIRYNRTFRTIGKMSWWRIVLGIVLMTYVVLVSGLVSQLFAAREQFRLAEKLMISPQWVEKYKPETKAFIEAGVLYQDGKLEEALSSFETIEGLEAADIMESRVSLKLASRHYSDGLFDLAYDYLERVDYTFLLLEEGEEYMSLCAALAEELTQLGDAQSLDQAKSLQSLINKYSDA